ncbi:hypothetical protein C9F11_37675 [Streptomyces sp. YIM 121038]|uniref:hypothetical protein n=1 Tax=Streptomyces sp. YIM 121038 TaxID=2136401 RepID=UPI001110A796|nr:hypothetical protein [Streptomyces sp. YIM 121038]QCX81118.1 hypothetical protein C9F11_37675 [Streptomyces sp. YIM 121038]
MSAPSSHDPVAVTTRDGASWLRHAVSVDGRGLYAVAGAVPGVPECVLASLADLAELGIVGTADVLPVPVGAEALRFHLDRLRAQAPERATELYPEEREQLAEILAGTAPATAGLVVAVAEVLRDCWGHEHPKQEDIFCGNLYGWMGERVGPVLRRLLDVEAEREGLRARVGELEAERHATNAVLADVTVAQRAEERAAARLRGLLAESPRPAPGACDACGSLPESWCPDCAACQKGCFGGFDGNACTHANASWGGAS